MLEAETEAAIVDALYQGAVDAAALEQALTLLMERFSCASSAILSFDSVVPATGAVLVAGLFQSVLPRYLGEFAAIDPAPAAFARLPQGRASTTLRLFDRATHRSAFVHDFYYPAGLAETMSGSVLADSTRSALIAVHRGPDRPPFTDEDIAALERLIPHATRALQMRRVFVRLEAKAAGLEHAVDRLEAGVLLLDSAGSLLFANRAVRAIAARADGFSLDRGGRPLPIALEARRRLNALIDAVARGGAGGSLRVPRRGDSRPYAVLVAPSPTPLAESLWDRSRRNGALILVHDPESRQRGTADIVHDALGLTPGAARLTAALVEGHDLQSYAAAAGLTIHTARFHLRNALARTETRSQAELVALAVRLLRDIGIAAR